jgi:predicted acetyltransferase
VTLDLATPADAPALANLLELYIHDLSAVFPRVELGEDGRYGYPKLPLYWSEPDQRFPFLIRCDGRLAGFALATRESATGNVEAFDIAEFFILRQHRRSGIGRRAAVLLWRRLPGSWTVRVSEGNLGALRFWARVIEDYTNRAATESQRRGESHWWRVFSFESLALTASAEEG